MGVLGSAMPKLPKVASHKQKFTENELIRYMRSLVRPLGGEKQDIRVYVNKVVATWNKWALAGLCMNAVQDELLAVDAMGDMADRCEWAMQVQKRTMAVAVASASSSKQGSGKRSWLRQLHVNWRPVTVRAAVARTPLQKLVDRFAWGF